VGYISQNLFLVVDHLQILLVVLNFKLVNWLFQQWKMVATCTQHVFLQNNYGIILIPIENSHIILDNGLPFFPKTQTFFLGQKPFILRRHEVIN
jgi:hypothetical protein